MDWQVVVLLIISDKMRALFIAPGYLPYTFSENLCNAKLVYALQKSGWEVDVISKVDEGPTYCKEWQEPWLDLRPHCYEVTYPVGNKVERFFDLLYSTIKMGGFPLLGIRWARRAFDQAEMLMNKTRYDAVFTRSPNDYPHLVGYNLKRKYGIKWFANWNDPADTIWPKPYSHHFSRHKWKMLNRYEIQCLKTADVSTFPSQSLLNHFVEHFPFLKEKNTKVIPHIALDECLFKARPKKKGENFCLCHSGNMSTERNPELLFSAMKSLIDNGKDNIRLDIMGQTTPFVEGLVEKYQLQHYIHFLGGFPYMEAVEKLLDYDVLVLLEAKLAKGIFFASKFTDYAQTNRPILAVSPKYGFASSVLSQYGGGLSVNNEDIDDITNGLNKLYRAWDENTLSTQYDTNQLLKQFAANTVVDLYNSIDE